MKRVGELGLSHGFTRPRLARPMRMSRGDFFEN